MKVKVDDKYEIRSDEHNFVVWGKSSGEKKLENPISYHGTIQGACKSVIQRRVKDSTAETLDELLLEIRKMNSAIERKVGI